DLLALDVAEDVPGVPYALGTESQLAYTADASREHGVSVQTAQVDVRSQVQIDAAIDRALQRFGQIDILVNCAGIAAPSGKIANDISEDEWTLMVDVDLNGAWRMIRAVGRIMVEGRTGSIIN